MPVLKYQILRRLDGGMQMMEWDFAVLLALSLLLFVWRWRKGEASVGDYLIMSFAWLTSILIFVLNVVAAGELITFWRYHYPVYALLLGYCGCAVSAVCRRFRWARLGFAVAIAAVIAVTCLRPFRHGNRPEKYAAESVFYAHRRAAELIRGDWTGPASSPRKFDLRDYRSARRPLVAAYDRMAGYWCGGRSVDFDFPCDPGDVPDYWLISDHEDEVLLHWMEFCPEVSKRKLAEIGTGREVFTLYRTERRGGE